MNLLEASPRTEGHGKACLPETPPRNGFVDRTQYTVPGTAPQGGEDDARIHNRSERAIGVPTPAALAYGWLSEQYSRLTGRPALATVAGVRTLLEMHATSSAKAVRELGVTFRPLEETLRDEVAWFRAHTPERVTAPGAPQRAA
jgi:hypothetical protein